MKHTILGFSCLLLMGLSWQVGAYDEDDLQELLGTRMCPKCDLTGVDLSEETLKEPLSAFLEGTNLSGANLTGADLTRIYMSQVNLTGADLSGANLTDAYLGQVNLTGTNLTNTDLTGAEITDPKNFNTANTAGAIFCQTMMPDGSTNNSGCTETGTIVDSIWYEGGTYTGELVHGKPHGQGTLNSTGEGGYASGKYVGEWRDGRKHGQGTFKSKKGIWGSGEEYVGEWKDGRKHGQGSCTWPDGTKYLGEWKDGRMHGQGTRTNADGVKYAGEWKDGEKDGQGIETTPEGEKHVGEWRRFVFWEGAIYDKDCRVTFMVSEGKPVYVEKENSLSGYPKMMYDMIDMGGKDRDCPPPEIVRASVKKLTMKHSCEKCNLAGVVFTKEKLVSVNLQGANMTDTRLRLVNLNGANLKEATLEKSILFGSSLEGANLSGANLSGAIIFGTSLKNANLEGANLTRASAVGTDFTGATLRNAKMTGFQEGTDMTFCKTIMPDGMERNTDCKE